MLFLELYILSWSSGLLSKDGGNPRVSMVSTPCYWALLVHVTSLFGIVGALFQCLFDFQRP
jgi:hypothetical protein